MYLPWKHAGLLRVKLFTNVQTHALRVYRTCSADDNEQTNKQMRLDNSLSGFPELFDFFYKVQFHAIFYLRVAVIPDSCQRFNLTAHLNLTQVVFYIKTHTVRYLQVKIIP